MRNDPRIGKLLDQIEADYLRTFEEQKRITQIPCSAIQGSLVRAEYFLGRMRELGFK